MLQTSWIEHIQKIHIDLHHSPSQFVQYFSDRLTTTLDKFVETQSSFPLSSQRETSAQKALVHAFQLYDSDSLSNLIANYDDSQDIQKVGLSILKKGLHSLLVIPNLESLAATPSEKNQLALYRNQLKIYIAYSLSCPSEKITQSEYRQQMLKSFALRQDFDSDYQQMFFYNRLDLLFAPSYLTYLVLRNRYFLNQLLEKIEDFSLHQWLGQTLDQIDVTQSDDLRTRLISMNFRTVEYLMRLILRHTKYDAEGLPAEGHLTEGQSVSGRNAGSSAIQSRPNETGDSIIDSLLSTLSEDERTENFSDKKGIVFTEKTIQHLKTMENVGILPPLAKESQEENGLPSVPAPTRPLERTPFELLCFKYLKELIYLANHAEFVTECNAPYFYPKLEDYTSRRAEFIDLFFESDKKISHELTNFVVKLLQKTERENPFEKQKEEVGMYVKDDEGWELRGVQERNREWSLMLKSQLPFSLTLSHEAEGQNVSDSVVRPHPKEIRRIEKGHPFAIQMGTSFFDYDLPKHKRSNTKPIGYFKVLVKGAKLDSNSAVIYVGNDPFFKLTDSQLIQWRSMILLFIIVARNKYSVELPIPFQNYLVRAIPQHYP